MSDPGLPVYALTPDRMTLTVRQRVPGGVKVLTVHRRPDAGPFTDADVMTALRLNPDSSQMRPGQRNITRRTDTRFGTLWTHVMTGPPTWWLPRLKREKDGTVMAGWLRLAVAVRLERLVPFADQLTGDIDG
jgi:hypothetical protein